MRCSVPGRGIRPFAKAIQCLAKIGDELYIESQDSGLALKTVNSARSAYACFVFLRPFFLSYNDGLRGRRKGGKVVDEEDTGGERGEPLKCKINIKSFVSVFKALSTLERTVDHFTLHLDHKESKLVFVFHCKHGIVKTHNLCFQECEALEAVFTKDLSPNHIAGNARIISEVVTNFPNTLEEVTLTAQPDKVRLKNYAEEDSIDGDRVPLTEIFLMPAEFDEYQIGVDMSVTFCLRELKAVLLFTDAINHSLSVRFESAGKPIVFSIDDSQEYKADFVLATLLDPGGPTHCPSPSTLSHVPSAVQTAQKKQNGHREVGAMADTSRVTGGQDSCMDEDGVDQDQLLEELVLSKGGQKCSASDKSRTNISAVDSISLQGPSGAPRAPLHVPPPPTNVDVALMDMDVDLALFGAPPPRATRAPPPRASSQTATGRREASHRVYDPVDALFEFENQNDVAKDGDVFGCVEAAGVHTPSTMRTPGGGRGKGKGKGKGKKQDLKRTDALAEKRDRAVVASEEDQFFDDFTFNDMFVKKGGKGSAVSSVEGPTDTTHHPPQGASLLQTEMECDQTQDSLVDDSGFLPSTPPAKKFKSVLFGMDMFGRQHSQSEVLAPDSDED